MSKHHCSPHTWKRKKWVGVNIDVGVGVYGVDVNGVYVVNAFDLYDVDVGNVDSYVDGVDGVDGVYDWHDVDDVYDVDGVDGVDGVYIYACISDVADLYVYVE